jgi:MFS family permease
VTDPTASLRDFRILWLGQVVSALGTRVSGVAFPLLTLTLTGSATKAGAVGFAGTLPLLVLTLHAGALVDRYDRKRMMLACEAARAVALASVAAGVLWGFISFWQLMAVAVVDGAGFTLFEIAQRAALRQLVPVARLPQAAALNQGREYGALLLGMPIGGVLYGISRTIPFLADAVSYAASFISLLLIRRPLNDIRASDTGMRVRLRDEIGEGVLWLWRQPFLRTCSLLVIASDLTVNALYLVVVPAKRHVARSVSCGGSRSTSPPIARTAARMSNSSGVDVDRDNVRVELERRPALFMWTETALLDAAERHVDVGARCLRVDVDQSSFGLRLEASRRVEARGEDRG